MELNVVSNVWDIEIYPWILKYLDVIGWDEISKCYNNSYVSRHGEECRELIHKKIKEIGLDPYAPRYITDMSFYVNHDLADGRLEAIPLRIYNVMKVLTEGSYFKDIYGISTDEIDRVIENRSISKPDDVDKIDCVKLKQVVCLRMLGKKLRKLYEMLS